MHSGGGNLSNRERLASFLKALDEASILTFNKNYFNHRLKLQKYVYIARNFGFRAPYSYSLYLHGPYSPSLADDYYAIDNFQNKRPLQLDERFIKLVKNRSEEWLELAATIIMIKKNYGNMGRHKLITLVQTTKPLAKPDELNQIISDLIKYHLLSQ